MADGAEPDQEVPAGGARVVRGVDEVLDQPSSGTGLGEGVDAKVAADRPGDSAGGVIVAEQSSQPRRGVHASRDGGDAVRECHHNLAADVAAPQVSRDIDRREPFRCVQQVVVVGEDLCFGDCAPLLGDDLGLAPASREDVFDQAACEAIRLKEDHAPPAPAASCDLGCACAAAGSVLARPGHRWPPAGRTNPSGSASGQRWATSHRYPGSRASSTGSVTGWPG